MAQEFKKIEDIKITEEEIQQMNKSANKALGRMPWTRKRRIRSANESLRVQGEKFTKNKDNHLSPDTSNNLEEEEQYATELASEQERYQTEQQLIDFHNEGIRYGHPSYAKYGIVSLLGLITESTDFLDLIGVGVVVSKPVAFFLTFIIFLIFWFTNTKQKRAEGYVSKAEEVVETITANLAHIERRAFQAAKIARRFGATRFAARIRISSRLVKRNPLFKFASAGVANLIPFLAVFPWVLLGIYLSYRDEKRSYQNAQETAKEIADQIPELNST